MRLYSKKAFLFHYIKDTAASRRYVQKTKELIKQTNNSLEIAFCYEIFGIIEPKGSKEAEKYYLKAYQLFSKFGETENLIDVCFNLVDHYNKLKNWSNVIKYAQLSMDAIKESGIKYGRAKYLYSYTLQAYTELGNIEKGKETIAHLDSIRKSSGYFKYSLFEYMYLKSVGNFYSSINQYEKATQLYIEAFKIVDSLRKQKEIQLSNNMLTQNKLNIQSEKLKRFEVENKLKKMQIKVGLIVIAGVLVFLIFFSIYQRKVSKKTGALNLVLENKNKELETLATELKNALNAKTEFLNVMTHELYIRP
ncbi:hypothetical protein [Niabella ginsengisoli]|uniref:Tetratricopeptide repeat protein n=1 Tax=Niabella ginsengisoli TaxID=522298 RepID=A0ABS9SQX6_9BACT|nr:hypothetical protein [Niabella ginsengisoli]MCH5600798.1 hypothetical protein [Niabella ginsengisoli]